MGSSPTGSTPAYSERVILAEPDPALDPWFARELLRLQHDAYWCEAAIIDDDRLPPLGDDEVSLPAWRGRYLVAWDGVRLVGAVAWRDHGDGLDVDRLMVDPAEHHQGVGSALLRHVIDVAADRPVLAASGRDNHPAASLYAGHDFVRQRDEEVEVGLWVTHWRRDPSPQT